MGHGVVTGEGVRGNEAACNQSECVANGMRGTSTDGACEQTMGNQGAQGGMSSGREEQGIQIRRQFLTTQCLLEQG